LVVHVWIKNGNGEYLITKRAPVGSEWDNLWQPTGGCAVAGDDGFQTALKEAREEIGVTLRPENGKLFTRYADTRGDGSGTWVEVWLFEQEVDIHTVVLQPEETCGAKWATKDEILRIIAENKFIPRQFYPYLDALWGM
jgi:8-oxo-dGTP pyrophosphatase MutT (NUDIX family)